MIRNGCQQRLPSRFMAALGLVGASLIQDCRQLPVHTLAPRLGVGEGKFPAYAAASVSAPHSAVKVPQDAAAFLAPHPLGLLPVAAEVQAGMGRFGLQTLGDAAAMARESLVDQFGLQGGLAWDLAHGIDPSPLRPLRQEETGTERMALPAETASLELLLAAVDAPLRRAYARPLMRGRSRGAGRPRLRPAHSRAMEHQPRR